MSDPSRPSEAARLERLWAGTFGNEYMHRNANAGEPREPFWDAVLGMAPARTVLEVGCNLGGNLMWIAPRVPSSPVGVDVNEGALNRLRATLPSVIGVRAAAKELPFRDAAFELVYTAGVLIHQPEETLGPVVDELVRCSSRFVLSCEYYSSETVEVPYRGQTGALFKRDYGDVLVGRCPELRLLEQGFLGRDQGWDDATWWLFEREG
jgi:pseudaminic acid biosynthesis-associated methylase